jgi:PhnB protein
MKKKMKKAASRKSPAKKVAARRKASATKKKPAAIPAGYHTVTPYLVCRGASDAIAFYKKAFGAKEMLRMPMPDGKLAHAEVRIGDSVVMLGDESPQMGATAPQTIGGTAVHVFLYVKDVNKAFAQATAAGATVEMPPTDMFWGDRYAKLADPFGHKWSMATHIEDVSPKEMARRGAAAMSQPPPPQA